MTIPFKDDAWSIARDRYTEDLTEEEKQAFDTATLETIYYDASVTEKMHRAGSSSRALFEAKIKPFLSAIEQYGEALDIYSNSYSLILCPLWGSIRVVLQIAREFGKYFDRLVDMFKCIGDTLPRFRSYERLYSSHAGLLQALSIVYVDILRFCSEAKGVFRQAKHFSVINFKIVIRLFWKPFSQQFGQVMADFHQHRKNVEKEAGLAHMIESAGAREVELMERSELERQKREANRLRMLNMLSSIRYDEKHRKLQRMRQEGTGLWLFKTNTFMEWSASTKSCCLYCYGMPGSGKSVLTSTVVDTLLATVDLRKTGVAYYYCDYADHRTLETVSILGTIIMQLLRTIQIPARVQEDVFRIYDNGLRTPMVGELIGVHNSLIKNFSEIYIVIDGLDECDNDARHDMLSYINQIAISDISLVRVFVSCREEDQILHSLKMHSYIHLTASMLSDDIESFVINSVSSRIRSEDLRIRNPALEQEIIAELMAKADGMFLWVYFQLKDLCEASSDTVIRETLRNLPRGLTETYARIIEKINVSTLKTDLARKIFRWAACAKRPLGVEEMCEAIAFGLESKSWDLDVIPNQRDIIGSCGGLIVLDDDDQTVSFAHHTVQQFLHSKPKDDQMKDFHFQPAEADSLAGQVCVTYLSFTDFETQVTTVTPERRIEPSELLGSDIIGGMPKILGIGKYLFSIPYRLLGGNYEDQLLDMDVIKFLKPQPKKSLSSTMTEKYRLLNYVVRNWERHTKSWIQAGELNVNEKTWDQFQSLVLHKTLPFDFRAWGSNQPCGCRICLTNSPLQNTSSFPYMTIFNWAVHEGHAPLLLCLSEQALGPYYHHIKSPDNHDLDDSFQSESPMAVACGAGHYEVAKLLLTALRNHGRSEFSEIRPLIKAAANGHKNILRMLFRHSSLGAIAEAAPYALQLAARNGHEETARALLFDPWLTNATSIRASWRKRAETVFGVNTVLEDAPRLALHDAAECGHEAILKLILSKYGQMIDLKDKSGHTALHLVARHGHMKAARFLLSRDGIFFNLQSNAGETALHLAVKFGHTDLVRLLLEKGSDTELHSFIEGHTALHLAARFSHLESATLLLQFGADLEAKDAHSRTPIYNSVDQGKVDMVQFFLEWEVREGTSISIDIGNLLHLAISNEDEKMLKVLLRYGCLDKKVPFDITERLRNLSERSEILQTLPTYFDYYLDKPVKFLILINDKHFP